MMKLKIISRHSSLAAAILGAGQTTSSEVFGPIVRNIDNPSQNLRSQGIRPCDLAFVVTLESNLPANVVYYVFNDGVRQLRTFPNDGPTRGFWSIVTVTDTRLEVSAPLLLKTQLARDFISRHEYLVF